MNEDIKFVGDLEVFKKSHKLTIDIYNITSKYPKDEQYGLVSQMKRAASSINSNLIEGNFRSTRGEFKQFVGISRGSAAELLYQVQLSRDLGFIAKDQADTIEKELFEILKMLNGLIKSLKSI